MSDDLQKRNARLIIFLFCIVASMVVLAFASVPLYNLFCRVTGFAGTPQRVNGVENVQVLDREMTVRLNADTAPDLPWIFKPEQRAIDLKIGQRGLVSFYAKNRTNQPITGTAIYNVVPLKAGKYFHKVQCFCFGEQTLQPGQDMDMPVLFYVDPKIIEDRNMDDVTHITLSYTFFKAESETLDTALDAYYEVNDSDAFSPADE